MGWPVVAWEISLQQMCSSCVLRFANVVGWDVTPPSSCLPQPPLLVAIHVLELKDSDPLIGWNAELICTPRTEGVKSVIYLGGENKIWRINTCKTCCLIIWLYIKWFYFFFYNFKMNYYYFMMYIQKCWWTSNVFKELKKVLKSTWNDNLTY